METEVMTEGQQARTGRQERSRRFIEWKKLRGDRRQRYYPVMRQP